MVNRTTHRKGIVQVKTGQTPVNINELVGAADTDTDTYAFSTAGLYRGDPALLTEVISSEDVLQMARDEPYLLPARIRSWFDLASGRTDQSHARAKTTPPVLETAASVCHNSFGSCRNSTGDFSDTT
jgi:hypothetical protein